MKKTFKELTNDVKPLLVDFHATWCGPCKALAPTIKQVAKEMKAELRVIKIDIDKNQSLAQKLNIMGVPTLVLYKGGEIVWQQSGVMTAHTIKTEVSKHI